MSGEDLVVAYLLARAEQAQAAAESLTRQQRPLQSAWMGGVAGGCRAAARAIQSGEHLVAATPKEIDA